jgi:hypothetical protein
MKGHNYGICQKCGKKHEHPKGMLGKSNKGTHLGSIPWNKGLTKKSDPRIADYGYKVSLSFKDNKRERDKERWINEGKKSLEKCRTTEHQRIAGKKGFAVLLNKFKKSYVSLNQRRLFEYVKSFFNEAELEYSVSRTEKGRTLFLDVAVPSKMMDFEYDGQNWHSSKERIERDRERDIFLSLIGWKIIRVDKIKLKKIEAEGLKCVLV